MPKNCWLKIAIMSVASFTLHIHGALGAAGDLDPSFGVGGISTMGPGTSGDGELLLQSDGRILVGGGSGGTGIIARFDTAGALDPSFGVGGVVTVPGTTYVGALALQPDGKIVAAGNALTVLTVARFDQSGQLDPAFGVAFFATPNGAHPEDMTLQGDGKIVIAGSWCISGVSCTSSDQSDVFVARLLPDGSTDASFGASGFAQLDLDSFDIAPGVAIQPDGKVVVVTGTHLVRWTSGGALDPTFGVGGMVLGSNGRDVVVQPDGKLLTAAYSSVHRFDASGSPDAGFGVGGESDLSAIGAVFDAALQTDDKILFSGWNASLVTPEMLVIRLSGNGLLDPTFGSGGVVLIPGLALFAALGNVALQPDGRVLAAGTYGYSGPLVLVRLLGDAACGDGSVDAGEECDDGNLAGGDCCSAICQFEAVGSPCPGTGACTVGVCDAAGGCEQSVPASAGCMPALAGWAKVTIKNDVDDARDKVTWKWASSGTVAKADFGTPLTTTGMTLCVADGDGNLLFSTSAPAAGVCGTGACWRETSGGFKYADSMLTNGSVQKLKLQEGAAASGRIVVKARGAGLGLPVGPYDSPLRVRFLREDLPATCWDATYSVPTRSDAGIFKAKSD